MDRDEQSSYIEAVKCFQSLPALDPAIQGAKTRFEEFQSYHVVIADSVHQLVRSSCFWSRMRWQLLIADAVID